MNNTNKNPLSYENGFSFGGATRNRTGDRGVADLCLTAWPWRRIKFYNIIAPDGGFVKGKNEVFDFFRKTLRTFRRNCRLRA